MEVAAGNCGAIRFPFPGLYSVRASCSPGTCIRAEPVGQGWKSLDLKSAAPGGFQEAFLLVAYHSVLSHFFLSCTSDHTGPVPTRTSQWTIVHMPVPQVYDVEMYHLKTSTWRSRWARPWAIFQRNIHRVFFRELILLCQSYSYIFIFVISMFKEKWTFIDYKFEGIGICLFPTHIYTSKRS